MKIRLIRGSCGVSEQPGHESNFVQNARLVAFEVTFLDCAVGFDTFESILRSSQTSEPAFGSEQLLERPMIIFSSVVQMFSVNV